MSQQERQPTVSENGKCEANETVNLVFKSCDAAVGDILRVELLDYSGVLADCLQGHKERSADVSDTSWESRHFTFDVDFEKKFHQIFLPSTTREHSSALSDAVDHDDLTYEQVYWANKINNPMFSDEELAEMHGGRWENPAYQNMEQLMEERFSFLDDKEYDFGDDDDDVLETKSKHTGLPSPKAMLSSAKVSPQVFDSSPKLQRRAKSGSLLFSQVASGLNSNGGGSRGGSPVQGSSPLLSRSVSGSGSRAHSGHSSPFTGSPIIFRKDFLKGSPSPATESRFRF